MSQSKTNMPKELKIKCHAAIHSATIAAGASGLIPIPVADTVPISAAQVAMIVALGKVFDVSVSNSVAKAIASVGLAQTTGRTVVSSTCKAIPGIGTIAGMAIGSTTAAAITEALGWLVADSFYKIYQGKMKGKEPEDIIKVIKDNINKPNCPDIEKADDIDNDTKQPLDLITNSEEMKMDIKIIQGDITDMTTDAIVLPSNKILKEGSGTSSAIFEKAGRNELKKACDNIKSRMGDTMLSDGDAVPTLGYNLDVNYIIHAIVPKWKDGNSNEYELLCKTYISALNLADNLRCKSIAFPLIASGNNGFDLKLAYEIAEKAIRSFVPKYDLCEVILVIYGQKTVKLLKDAGVRIDETVNYAELKPNKIDETDNHKELKPHSRNQNSHVPKKQPIAPESILKIALNLLNDKETREEIVKLTKWIIGIIPKK